MRFVWVGVAGALGSMLRYGIGLMLGGTRFPWATLAVNLTGSFLLGLLLTAAVGRWPVTVTTPLAVGLVGGFTTYSTFAWEGVSMAQGGRGLPALVYITASVVGGLLAALAGYAFGRSL